MHRTVTLDYGIVTNGSITMVLEEGKNTVLNAGDIVVQRGTIHSWRNEGAEWARMYCVMLREYPQSRNQTTAEPSQRRRRSLSSSIKNSAGLHPLHRTIKFGK